MRRALLDIQTFLSHRYINGANTRFTRRHVRRDVRGSFIIYSFCKRQGSAQTFSSTRIETLGAGLRYHNRCRYNCLYFLSNFVAGIRCLLGPVLDNLEALCLRGCKITEKALALLCSCNFRPRNLDLSKCQLPNKAMTELKKLSSLESLSLYQCRIDDNGR
jgi:hypothetical protein